ncbi:sensor histidine kinase [Paenibacillus sp. KN14-4R]|uniref:sensor histidine kinase n=1 Tax=Paenibacillus sp. KN14-4R TaxID=3445773 RepID=UPI003F9F6D1C
MSFWRFISDRILYICAFYMAAILMLLVVWLAFSQQFTPIGWENITYMFLLCTAVVVVTLVIDWLRQYRYFESIKRAIEHENSLEASVLLLPPVTNEQAQIHAYIRKGNKTYTEELLRLSKRQELQQHFTNQWVHHMKTPVSVIELLNEQASITEMNEEQGLLWKSVAEENVRLAHGLDMMLHTARLDKFELDLHVRRLPLEKIVREIIHSYKKSCIRDAVFPKIEAPLETYIESDEKWLRLIINQLVSNAIKYCRKLPGSKTLHFIIEQDSQEVRLRVRDEGIGIASHDLPRVYDAFFTGENGRTSSESTGMGLFLAKQVCERLGHQIEIQSELGKGTEVTLTFTSSTFHKAYMTTL